MSEDQALADRALADMDSAITAPPAGVDVRALVNHLVAGNLHFAALVSQAPRPDQDADHLGADPLAAFDRAAASLRGAMARPGVLAGTYPLPFGPVPGAELARTRPPSTGSPVSSAGRCNAGVERRPGFRSE